MVSAKAIQVSNALNSIAKNIWGIRYDAARYIYLGAIEPILLYAAPIWAAATQTMYIQRKLLKAQRIAALRICTAYRTAPTSALLVIAGHLPVYIKAKMARLIWIISNKMNGEVSNSSNSHNNILSVFPDQIKNDIANFGIEHKQANSNYYEDYPTLGDNYLSENVDSDISIYTDGSKNLTEVGAAFILYHHNTGSTHRSAFKLGPHCTVPQAEILAIVKAMDHVYSDWFPCNKTITIYTDSMTALNSIFSPHNRGENIAQIHRYLSTNSHKHVISFGWVRGHTGVPGNEAADRLGKQAAASSLIPCYNKIPASKIKQWTWEFALSQWQEEWDNGSTGRFTHTFIPNVKERLKWKHLLPTFSMTQLITGHGNFNSYLKRFHLKDMDICPCDSTSIQDSQHYLWDCEFFTQERVRLMGHVLHAGNNWPCPYSRFMEDPNIYKHLIKFLDNNSST
ncbi:uncharacterized protein [Centruroides vittatus]|uniref:uncharacterized protein n=1 Tax=Centruroides vittatus TaxID=120091 RepID=UPI00350F548F